VPRIEESVDIAVGPADVFRFCHDITRRPKWDRQVVGIEMLTPLPIRQGALLRVDCKPPGGSVFTWDGEYVEFRLSMRSTLRVIDAASSSPFAAGSQLSWEFTQAGGSTRLTWVWDYRPRGFIARIRDSLGGRASTQRAIRTSLGNLKTMLEGGRRAGAN